jgi:HlyD family secretion protein
MAARNENGRQGLNGKRTWAILIGLVLAVIVLAAFVSLRRSRVSIRLGHVNRATITASIATNGKVEPIDNFEAHAPASTTVRELSGMRGVQARAGQLLLQLDDADARAKEAQALTQLRGAEAEINAAHQGGTQEEVLTTRNALIKAQAERDVAQRNYRAMQKLLQTGAASQAEVDTATNQLRIAEAGVQFLQQKLSERYSKPELGHLLAQEQEARASLQAAQDLLRNSNVVVPRNGQVYSLPVREGAFVGPGDLLVQVADLHKVRVRAFIDEPEIGKLQRGQPVEISWDALPGRAWAATLDTIPSTVVQRGTRMVGEVTCLLENTDLKLLPNTNVTVAVIAARHENAVVVPREAVHQDEQGFYVFEVVNGELKRRDVKTSISNLTTVEVTDGISDHATLALGAVSLDSLRQGMQVRPVN